MTDVQDDFYARLGLIIRDRRRADNITQEHLADRLELSRTTMVNIEKGRQRLAVHQLVQLGNALGCEPADLLPVTTGDGLSVAGTDRDEFAARIKAKAKRSED